MLPGFADAAGALDFALGAAVGQTVVCRRGALAIEIQATPGQTQFQSLDDSGAVEQFQSRDFLLLAADYAFDGKPTLPRRGDTIEEFAGDGASTLHEVMSPDAKSPPYRLDVSKTRLRIHTKQVKGR